MEGCTLGGGIYSVKTGNARVWQAEHAQVTTSCGLGMLRRDFVGHMTLCTWYLAPYGGKC